MNKYKINMYFHGVKSTAHPPIMGTLGHSTNFIVKQPNMVWSLIFICIDQPCCFFLEEKLKAEAVAAFTNNQAHWH